MKQEPEATGRSSGGRGDLARPFHIAMLLALVFGLLVAYATTADYGESWDESANSVYATASLEAYSGSRAFLAYGDQVYHGPFYLILWKLGSKAFRLIHPGWLEVDAGHFTNYLAFSLGAGSLYIICLRFASPAAAFGATLLFLLQPMLYGYAFINQKDIPFMALLTIAVAGGLVMVERFGSENTREALFARRRWERMFQGGLEQDLRRLRRLVVERPWRSLGVGVLAVFLLSVLVGFPYAEWLRVLVKSAYQGESWPMVNRLFSQVAQDQGSLGVEVYVAKAVALLTLARVILGLFLALGGVIGLRALFSVSLDGLGWPWLKRTGIVLGAGALTGLATSVRVAGPLAGGIVAIYFLTKRRWRAISPMLAYGVAAALVMFGTWPYLWGAPIEHLRQAYQVMASFKPHTVLYKGAYIQSDALPWDYLPTLMGLELTLPVLALFVWGSVVVIRRLAGGRQDLATAAVPTIWLGLPFLAFIVLRTPIYGNIRQVLFAIPPIFLLSAIGLDDIWRRLRRRTLKWGLLGLGLLPSVLGIVSLFPYEYIYFNALAGGTQGADGLYELDHWCTSYREAMAYVDRTAPKGATVTVWGPLDAAANFARPDLVVTSDDGTDGADYILGCKRALDDPLFHPDYETVFEVRRDSAVLAIVKQLRNQEQ
jgi:hypothetical protein